MTNPLHAPYYADSCVHRTVRIVRNEQIARDTFRVRLDAHEIAQRIVPGQFVMLRVTGAQDPLIGRPLALFDIASEAVADGTSRFLDVAYLVKGKFTSRLAKLPAGQLLDVWGPLGNGFSATPVDTLVMVAGGIGYTPFLTLAQEALGVRRFGDKARDGGYAKRVIFCYGARSESYLAAVQQFEEIGVDVRIATDDGSRGHRGFVTDLVRASISDGRINSTCQTIRIACCGPEPMMEAVSHLAEQASIPCEVSLETPMACGIGICFTCVAQVRESESTWDYKRTCVEGPVFDSRKIAW